MSNSLGISDGLVDTGLTMPTIPAIPTFPATVPLPTTVDGNVVAPPNVTPATPGGKTPVDLLPPPPAPPPSMPAPEPTFWDDHGDFIIKIFAVVGAVSALSYFSKRI